MRERREKEGSNRQGGRILATIRQSCNQDDPSNENEGEGRRRGRIK
jgi:hypothetical protein